jgi:hypothetical protein
MPGPCTIDSVQLLCGSDEYNHGVCCHTSVAELDSTFDDNYAGNTPDTAMSMSPLTLNWTNNTWHGLPFDRPFDYDGAQNLIIEYRWEGDDENSVYDRGFYTTGNRACNVSSSTAPRGVPRNYMPRHRIFYSATGVAAGSVMVPGRTALRASPNPSRAGVLFMSPVGTAVSIYTADGRFVRTLKTLSWDGNDVQGRLVAAGIYVCRAGATGTAVRIVR